jgi:Insulin-induced protein (INSIG)
LGKQPQTVIMSSDEPHIFRPEPRRPFNPNTIAQQPPSPLLAPISVDETPSRTHSVLNLTSSTLLGIYSPTGYDNERDEPSTPWGTGSETPALTSAYYPARRPKFSPSPPEQPLLSFAFSLVIRTVLLGGIGMLYGLLVRHLHDEQQLAPFGVEGIIKPRNDWTYLVFWAAAGVAWGTLLPWVDTLYADQPDERAEGTTGATKEKATRSLGIFGADWTRVVRSVGAFVGIAFAIVRSSIFLHH